MTIPENKFTIGEELFFVNHNGAIRKGKVIALNYVKWMYAKPKKSYEGWYYEFIYKDQSHHPYTINEKKCAKNIESLVQVLAKETA